VTLFRTASLRVDPSFVETLRLHSTGFPFSLRCDFVLSLGVRPVGEPVAVRICPHCKGRKKKNLPLQLPRRNSNSIDCPQCKARLEVCAGRTDDLSLCGLAAAAIAMASLEWFRGDLGAVLPTLYAFLAFGAVSAASLMFTRICVTPPALPSFEPAPCGGHPRAAGHH